MAASCRRSREGGRRGCRRRRLATRDALYARYAGPPPTPPATGTETEAADKGADACCLLSESLRVHPSLREPPRQSSRQSKLSLLVSNAARLLASRRRSIALVPRRVSASRRGGVWESNPQSKGVCTATRNQKRSRRLASPPCCLGVAAQTTNQSSGNLSSAHDKAALHFPGIRVACWRRGPRPYINSCLSFSLSPESES